MINVVIYTGGYDTGGQGYRLKRALEAYHGDEFKVTSIHTAPNYFHYPSDVQYRASTAPAIFAGADVIHMRNGLEGLKKFRPDAFDGEVGLICHWHGTRFREEHKRLYPDVAAAGALQLVSTIDLAMLEPELVWLPSPVNLAEMAVFRAKGMAEQVRRFDPDRAIRIFHSPTNRAVKSTDQLMAELLILSKKVKVELDLVEKKPWHYVLERKAQADVLFDQIVLGYGNNALEAWAMGIPVIAGMSDPLARRVMAEVSGGLPFFEATKSTVYEALAALATDQDLRAQWGLRGYDHVVQFHDDRKVADQLAGLYRQALERRRVA